LQEKVVCLDCPLTKNSLKEVCRGLIDLSTMSHRSTGSGCCHWIWWIIQSAFSYLFLCAFGHNLGKN
jgi:hypothetical protein